MAKHQKSHDPKPARRLFTDQDIVAAREEYLRGQDYLAEYRKRTIAALAARYGVAVSSMHGIIRGDFYRDVS